MAVPQQGRTVPEVLQDIIGNIQEIIRSEFRLAKAEIKQEASKAAAPVKMWVIGGVLGLYGFGFLLYTAVLGLAVVMPTWLAGLVVGGLLTIVALVLISSATKKLKTVNAPERTIESLKENVQWAKDQIK